MAARRSRKPTSTAAPAAAPAPAQSLARTDEDDDDDEPDGDEEDEDEGGDEDAERAEKVAEGAERRRRALAGVSKDDEDDDDDEGAEPELESHRERKLAVELNRAENKAALNAHDHAVAKAARRGGKPTTKEIRQAVETARKRVRDRALVHRTPGIYTAEPFTTIDEKGNRLSCPAGMRIPDSLVAGLKSRRDLKRLIRQGVLADLR